MKILISGAGGLIGTAVSRRLRELETEVSALSRADLSLPAAELAGKLSGADVLINLAGAPVSRRWTRAWKKEMYGSRIGTTARLAEALRLCESPPHTFVSASATGIYPTEGTHDEFSAEVGHDYLAVICRDWEKEAQQISSLCRVIILRFGVALSTEGGALARLLPVFRLGAGGAPGTGRQPLPWIHIDDLISALVFLLGKKDAQGVYNIVAPQIITARSFASSLGACLKRPSFLPVPGFVLRAVLGEGASILTEGQRVLPRRLISAGFPFGYPDIQQALCHLLGKS